MHMEYERRWLAPDAPVLGHIPTMISQAYLFVAEGWCLRVRRSFRAGGIRDEPGYNTLAVKGPRLQGARAEYEWELPAEVALPLYRAAPYKLVKARFQLIHDEQLWDIDVFYHDNEGLVIAECETPPGTPIDPPPWCLEEITPEPRYNNENLALSPFKFW